MLTSLVSIGLIGAVTIGGVVIERRFAEEGKTNEAKIIGDSLFHLTRIGSICFIGYALAKVMVWFL